MPMYDYSCVNTQCPEPKFESLQKMNEDFTIQCPSCGGTATREEVSQLRRTDWYANSSSVRIHFNWTKD